MTHYYMSQWGSVMELGLAVVLSVKGVGIREGIEVGSGVGSLEGKGKGIGVGDTEGLWEGIKDTVGCVVGVLLK
eukprot:CAMPEP_0114389332 /NCGR_PEP_ID=MMETSP0102-20121206/8598_1 /TAXON_ID=38822 ORGANISM="Pteridomonas danica, Strain PT" /NCGR_SAMPLE_ID=MMETSP0102 /ASSEMBLY_ACC=CAM_ASM_000212 /LENGTH=73 /DNA_ID=CAMNT_0001547217 /DNA_START=302 /DNA_END=522 /DNA_ORIENTATION=+